MVIGLTVIILAGSVLAGQNTEQKKTDSKEKTKMKLTVAVAQIPETKDISKNAETISRAIDFAIKNKADILLTPEGSLSGYTSQFDQRKVSEALEKIVSKAAKANLALALGTCYREKDDGKCYNQIRFYDGRGNFLGFHSKILRCGTMTENPIGEINEFAARPLRTYQLDGITIGGLICNDMWANPQCTPMPDTHLSHQLSGMGAKIIFHSINGGRSDNEWSKNVIWNFHEMNLRMRAQAGKVWVVTADNCVPTDIPCSAPSGVINPNGNWTLKLPSKGEHIGIYTIDLE